MAAQWILIRFDGVGGEAVRQGMSKVMLGAMAVLGAGLALAEAQKQIQANLDASPAAGVTVRLDDLGMQQGATGKLWSRTKVYPNRYWADFTLTPEGKKAVKISGGGETIQWRPDSPDDKKYSLTVETVAQTHAKAKDLQAAQDETVDGGKGKSVVFSAVVGFEGVPEVLQQIAHNPGNKLSTKHEAKFVLDGGAWKLKEIQ
jgi:hypothetical protein